VLEPSQMPSAGSLQSSGHYSSGVISTLGEILFSGSNAGALEPEIGRVSVA
jgi:hypothetical protein